MKNISKIILSSIGVLLVLFGVVYVNNLGDERVMGSISGSGDAYNATTTNYLMPTNYPQGVALKIGQGILGSVVISNATAVGTLDIYDATTTINGAVYGTTTLAQFNTGATSGTYTFDVAFSKGLLIIPSAMLASSTVTWK